MANASYIIEGFGTHVGNAAIVIAPDLANASTRPEGDGTAFFLTATFVGISGILALGLSMAAVLNVAAAPQQHQPVICVIT